MVLELSTGTMVEGAKCEQMEKIVIGKNNVKFFQAGVQLPHWKKEEPIDFLKKNIDVFAWNTYEAPRVDPDFICHHLNVNPSVPPKGSDPDPHLKNNLNAIRKEVLKLKRVGAINEVFYPKWLANTVVVKKKSGKWWVCVDFTNLNKACPKDPFPLPRIDQLVDATTGHLQMSFLDIFQGYH